MTSPEAFLATILLAFLNFLIATKFYEYSFATRGQKTVSAIITLLGSFLFVDSISEQSSYFFMFPIFLISYSVILIDWATHTIPNRLTFYLAILQTLSTLIRAVFEQSFTPFLAIYFAIATFVIFFLMSVLSKDQIGMGDVKLSYSLVIGIGSVSIYLIPWALLYTFLTAGIFAFILLLTQKASLKSSFAFGPFMIVGSWLTILVYRI